MVNVCARYSGTVILLAECETEEEAKAFMKNDYVLFYADELEGIDDDEIIYSNEMFIEDELPFYEPVKINYGGADELPF